jgi:hypothetical protein
MIASGLAIESANVSVSLEYLERAGWTLLQVGH